MSQQAINNPTVLIFDSGVGGLSVYKEIKALLPELSYIYLFDREGFPYGELPKEVLIRRTNQLIDQVMTQHQVDCVVIACNTASTIVLPSLREKLTIPVVGVVPAIKPASDLATKAVGLIATPATVQRDYTYQLIKEFSADKEVKLLGSTLLVEMAEAKLRGETVCLQQLREILHPIYGSIDVAVLGCTHFPLLKQEISEVLGKEVSLIDSGHAIARRVASLLKVDSRSSESSEKLCKVYSSAIDDKTTALTNAFMSLGFPAIEMLPIQDV